MLSECISLGPAVVADDIDEIAADERWVEILEYVGVDVSESAVRAVFVAVVERAQYPALEIWSWVTYGANMGPNTRTRCSSPSSAIPSASY